MLLRSLGGQYALGVEGRWHTHLFPGQREPDAAGGFWTVGAILRRSW